MNRLRPGMFAAVQFGDSDAPALLVPTEAVIRTGRRAIVMVAGDGGRYAPAEVRTGREAAGKTEVLAGLSQGEKVVASGQFLIDSEASLAGVKPRPPAQPTASRQQILPPPRPGRISPSPSGRPPPNPPWPPPPRCPR